MLPNGSAAMPVTARRVERLPSDKGYVPVYTTAVVEQPWQDYGVTDHATWGALYRRQRELLEEFERLSSTENSPQSAGFFSRFKDFFGLDGD